MKKFSSINRVVAILINSDLVFFSAFGLIAPIFAVFITEQIKGGDIRVAGFAVGIYWILKSIFQIPVGRYLDKHRGEKDDLYFLVIGSIITAFIPFGYIFSSTPWHIYLLQVVYSIGMAMAYPSWCAIFTRHIDKGKEAYEWGLNATITDLGIGIAGILGGLAVSRLGFDFVFAAVGVLAIIGAILPILIYKHIAPRRGPIQSLIPRIKKLF